MKEKVLNLLRNTDDFISGEKLSNELGVSRTAIWKYITKLKKEGYEIESLTRKGYRLLSIPDTLTEQEILYNIGKNTFWKKVYCYDEIDSTNQEAKRKVLQGAEHGTIIVSDCQKQGKGRKGRIWMSPHGEGIWFSCILKPNVQPSNASMLTLTAGLSVCKAIRKVTGLDAYIKWPNDVVINDKKVCGILTEMSTEIDQLNYIVIGIGINVNTKEFPDEIKNKATSLKIEGDINYKRIEILKIMLEEFEKNYELFLKKQDLSNIIEQYKKYCININRIVKVIERNKVMEGEAISITEKGELLLKTNKGDVMVIRSGEVSVRGLYGYV